MNRTIIKWSIIGVIVLFGLTLFSGFVSFSNRENDLKTSFKAAWDDRSSYYQNTIYASLSAKSQIVLKNDSSFKEFANIIMSGRKDGQQVLMKWVQENNPDFKNVSSLYADLSRAVESARSGFVVKEEKLQDIVKQHSRLLGNFPGPLYNFFLNKQPLEYKPITSTATDKVIESGKDDNVKLF